MVCSAQYVEKDFNKIRLLSLKSYTEGVLNNHLGKIKNQSHNHVQTHNNDHKDDTNVDDDDDNVDGMRPNGQHVLFCTAKPGQHDDDADDKLCAEAKAHPRIGRFLRKLGGGGNGKGRESDTK